MLQYIRKRNHFTSARIESVTYHLIIRIKRRSDVLQRAVTFSLLHMTLQQVESVVNREVLSCILQIECIKTSLCFFQRNIQFTSLQHLVRVVRRETKSHSAINNIFAQSQRQINRSFLGFLVSDRIVIQRTCHSRHGRIIFVAILSTHYFLKNNGHLLLINNIGSSLHISLTVFEVDRSVYPFDRV